MRRSRLLLWMAVCLLLGACTAPPVMPSGPAGATARAVNTAAGAQAALEAAVQAYAQDDLQVLEALLPARFIGRSLLLEAAQATLNEQKQVRVTLSEWQTSGAPNASTRVLSAHWDKRYLKLPGLVPGADSGTVRASMRFESGRWLLDTLGPDNPLTR